MQDQYEKYDGTPETVKMGVHKAAVSAGATADVLINFASGTQGVGNLSGVYIDNLILAWLGASPGGTRLARLGWTLHDFVETDYDTIPYGAMSIIQLVIDSNNHHYGHYSKMFSVGWPPPPTLRRVQKLRRRQAWLSATEDVPEGSP